MQDSLKGTPSRSFGNGERLLYLDDEEALASLVKRSLERRGYEVSTFVNADEALAAVVSDPMAFDYIITDFNMPRMSGTDFAREIASLRPDLPVVLTSGYISDAMRDDAKAAGIRQVVYKPDTADELCAAIDRIAKQTVKS